MKTLALVFSLLLTAFVPRPVAEQPVASQIERVTVFQRGAQVTRTATVRVPAGTTDLVFTGLTPDLDPQSLQVNAEGRLTILSVTHRLNYFEASEPTPEAQALIDRRDAKQDSLQVLQATREVYQQEQSLLLENKSLGGNDGVEVAQLREAADFFRSRLTEIRTRLLALDDAIERINEDIRQLNNQLGELRAEQQNRRTSEVVVTVSADNTLRSDFTVRYVTMQAGWSPRYDLRVEAVGQPIDLAYNANVAQTSGEEWTNVRLTLSTGDPAQQGTVPELTPWRLGFYEPNAYRNQSARQRRNSGQSRVQPGPPVNNPRSLGGRVTDLGSGRPLPGVNVVVDGGVVGTTTDASGFYAISVLPNDVQRVEVSFVGYAPISYPITSNRIDFMLAPDAVGLDEVVVQSEGLDLDTPMSDISMEAPASLPVPVQQVQRATSVEFEIALPYTIPPDGKPRTVQIDQIDIPASYEYVAVPKLDASAYLTARAVGWENYNLLSGPSNLFFEGTYVGESYLDVSNVEDTLVVSLGQDDGVLVERRKQTEFSDRSFLGGRRTETLAFEIDVRNTKPQPIEITLRDQIPVSTNDRIDVNYDPDGGARLDDDTGIITWRLTVPPSSSRTVSFRYDVRYPRDRTVILE